MGKLNRSKPLKIKGKASTKRSPIVAAKSAMKVAKPPVSKQPAAKKPVVRKAIDRAVAKPKAAVKPAPQKMVAKPAIVKPDLKKPFASGKAAHAVKPVVSVNGASAPVKKMTMKSSGKKNLTQIVLPDGYRPSESEPFMGDHHRVYFRKKLLQWKEDIIQQNRETLHVLHEDTAQHADLADRATSETDRALELRARDRQRKLVAKIDAALSRIEDGSYGFCEETGEPISIKRLDARPIATLSLEAQERHERRERVYRDE